MVAKSAFAVMKTGMIVCEWLRVLFILSGDSMRGIAVIPVIVVGGVVVRKVVVAKMIVVAVCG